jgi:hypothetical protein
MNFDDYGTYVLNFIIPVIVYLIVYLISELIIPTADSFF